ncbi:unnamed protein product [Hymenolepis diminuta]|uniref:Uncharacterized protein n=1 Tax=Hymenolepis diminuta TaxID=6216 RepID=A0A564YSS2_HYMDI|nr:unnamed protein product [Hymenolepis diminuta]
MRVLIQVTIINSLPLHTQRNCRLSDTSSFAPSFPSVLHSPWDSVLRFVQ